MKNWLWMGMGLILGVSGTMLWQQRSGVGVRPSGSPGATESSVVSDVASIRSGGLETAEAARMARPRPFARKSDVVASPVRVPWQSRIRTNGVLDAERMRTDPEYLRRVMQHDKLKVLLRTPARETPEFERVIEFVERKGLPLAATMDLYNILWATKDHERRMDTVPEQARAPVEAIRDLEVGDFKRRFQRDFDMDLGPILDEFLGLGIRPEVYMGIPDRGLVAGEALLTDRGGIE